MILYFSLAANNDTNGNPRRCFVVIDGAKGAIIAVQDEGYAGDRIRDTWPDARYLGRFDTTPSQRKALLRGFPTQYEAAKP